MLYIWLYLNFDSVLSKKSVLFAEIWFLNEIQEDLAIAQSGNNWRLLMSYFNMIQLIESSGIGLVYGLRFYGQGQLSEKDVISYVRTNALLYEYYKQARELIPEDIGEELVKLFNSEDFIIVNTRYNNFFLFLFIRSC